MTVSTRHGLLQIATMATIATMALAAAAFFLVHPLATSTVNSPGFREEILALVFLLAALPLGLSVVAGNA